MEGSKIDSKYKNPPIVKSFAYAARGVVCAIKASRQLKIIIALGIVAFILCFALRCNLTEWAIVVLMTFLVIASECFNTAIEYTVDLFTIEYDKRAELAKDIAAGAVLFLSIGSIVVGSIVFVGAAMRLVS